MHSEVLYRLESSLITRFGNYYAVHQLNISLPPFQKCCFDRRRIHQNRNQKICTKSFIAVLVDRFCLHERCIDIHITKRPPMILHFTLNRVIWETPELAVKMAKLGERSVWIFFVVLPSKIRIAGNQRS